MCCVTLLCVCLVALDSSVYLVGGPFFVFFFGWPGLKGAIRWSRSDRAGVLARRAPASFPLNEQRGARVSCGEYIPHADTHACVGLGAGLPQGFFAWPVCPLVARRFLLFTRLAALSHTHIRNPADPYQPSKQATNQPTN